LDSFNKYYTVERINQLTGVEKSIYSELLEKFAKYQPEIYENHSLAFMNHVLAGTLNLSIINRDKFIQCLVKTMKINLSKLLNNFGAETLDNLKLICDFSKSSEMQFHDKIAQYAINLYCGQVISSAAKLTFSQINQLALFLKSNNLFTDEVIKSSLTSALVSSVDWKNINYKKQFSSATTYNIDLYSNSDLYASFVKYFTADIVKSLDTVDLCNYYYVASQFKMHYPDIKIFVTAEVVQLGLKKSSPKLYFYIDNLMSPKDKLYAYSISKLYSNFGVANLMSIISANSDIDENALSDFANAVIMNIFIKLNEETSYVAKVEFAKNIALILLMLPNINKLDSDCFERVSKSKNTLTRALIFLIDSMNIFGDKESISNRCKFVEYFVGKNNALSSLLSDKLYMTQILESYKDIPLAAQRIKDLNSEITSEPVTATTSNRHSLFTISAAVKTENTKSVIFKLLTTK
jgi:hypothetical protein